MRMIQNPQQFKKPIEAVNSFMSHNTLYTARDFSLCVEALLNITRHVCDSHNFTLNSIKNT